MSGDLLPILLVLTMSNGITVGWEAGRGPEQTWSGHPSIHSIWIVAIATVPHQTTLEPELYVPLLTHSIFTTKAGTALHCWTASHLTTPYRAKKKKKNFIFGALNPKFPHKQNLPYFSEIGKEWSKFENCIGWISWLTWKSVLAEL